MKAMKYQDFMFQLTKKHFVTFYKQTVLGPILQLISPILQSGLFAIIFSVVLKIGTDNQPPFLFYTISVIFFNHFRNVTTRCSNVYFSYQGLFRSFYFPKIIMFLSLTLEGLAIYTIQLLFIVFMLLFYAFEGHEVVITISAILLSLLPIVYISVLSLFLGITFSSLTIKYRDLNHFLTYIMQILFFTSPVLFSNSVIEKKIEWIFHLNPLYYHLCFYRSIFLKNSVMPNISFLYSSLIILAIFFVISKYAYKHAEKTFDDFV